MRLAILGASGHGKVVADTAKLAGWHEVVFFDDAWPKLSQNGPWEVLGDAPALLESLGDFDGFSVAIGDNVIRRRKQQDLIGAGGRPVSLVHPSAVVSEYALIGVGSVIFANVVVNACAVIGEGCIVNTGAVVEHDCFVGDFTHISPNAVLAGGVHVGAESWIGANASIHQMITVGHSTLVGMGAVVVDNVGDGLVVAGVPARPIYK